MVGRKKSARTLGEHGIFGDEEAAELRAELDELRAGLVELGDRVHAQFTTIAAHAEIAREQNDLARAESRADLDRTRESLIALMETLRTEVTEGGVHITGTAPGPSGHGQSARLDAIEQQVAELAANIERCFARQNELADTMAAFLDTLLADQRGEPVAGLSMV